MSSEKKYLYNPESNMTLLQYESTLETPKAFKYLEYWKRARRVIKFNSMLTRFNNYARSNPYIVNPEVLQGYLSLLQEKPKVMTKTFVFMPHGPYYMLWTLIIILSLIYLSSYGIFHTAFIGDSVNSEVIKIEAFIDIVFIFDIFIHLNVAVYDSKNNLVTDRRTIFLYYLKSRLLIDLLAGIPTGFFEDDELSSIFLLRHFFKMLKWIGITKKLANFTFLKSIDSFLITHRNLIESVLLWLAICSIVHIFACLFYLAARYENFSYETWVVKSGIQDFSMLQKYTTSLYFLITTLSTIGYGEIRPYTTIEQCLTIFWSFIGLILVSISVSYFTILIERIFKSDLIITERICAFEDFSKVIGLPTSSIKSTKKFIRDQKIVIHKFEISKVLESLDINLKYEIALNIYNQGIQKIAFFDKKSSEFLSQVTFLLEFFQCEENEYIWRKNSSTDGLFFLISGKVKFMHNEMLFSFYYDGGFFGDLEIFLKCERKFDVMVCETCQCFKMNLKTLKLVKEKFPKYYGELKNLSKIRKNNLLTSLAQMVVVLQYQRGEIFNISKSYIETVKDQCFIDLFSMNYSANKSSIIKNAFYDLKNISHHKNRIKNLLKSLNIHQNDFKIRDNKQNSSNLENFNLTYL